MKIKVTILLALLISISSLAQQGVNYKAVIKGSNGNLIASQTIDMKVSILKNNMTPIYAEDHTIDTDDNGIIILNIGEGNATLNVYANIDWSVDNYLLKVEVDIEQDGSYEDMGNTPLKAVPYALHATKATSAFEADQVVKLPEPYILGRSTQVSNARFSFNGKYGWQAAQEMCEASYPNDPNVRAFTLEQIAQAIVLGNWDANNLSNIEDFWFWAITPYAVGSGFDHYQSEEQNGYGLNYIPGDAGNGTQGQIRIDHPPLTNGFNPTSTYLMVHTDQPLLQSRPCMCGTYN